MWTLSWKQFIIYWWWAWWRHCFWVLLWLSCHGFLKKIFKYL